MPDSERARRLEELHSAALKRDASERDQFPRQACGGDAEMRRAVESLLGYEQELDGFWKCRHCKRHLLEMILKLRLMAAGFESIAKRIFRNAAQLGFGKTKVAGCQFVFAAQAGGENSRIVRRKCDGHAGVV